MQLNHHLRAAIDLILLFPQSIVIFRIKLALKHLSGDLRLKRRRTEKEEERIQFWIPPFYKVSSKTNPSIVKIFVRCWLLAKYLHMYDKFKADKIHFFAALPISLVVLQR